MRHRKTDYGTIILHWTLVGALAVAFVTGLRIATETPDRTWINAFDLVLPRISVWTAHMPAAVVLVAVALGYAVYIGQAGLRRRIQLDGLRLRGLFGGGQARWGAINVVLYWVFFIAMLSQIATGGLLYFGIYVGHGVATLHWYGTWVILGYAGLHVLAHAALGGTAQLLRIVRPAPIAAPPLPLDAGDLLTMLVEQSERHGDARAADRRATVHANPLVVAMAAALSGVMVLLAVDRQVTDGLQIHRINFVDAPILDGDTSDGVWHTVKPLTVTTTQGGNFDGTGETRIEIRAVHDGTWAYFLFAWDDPTRSLKQLPLLKAKDGWHLLHDGYEAGDEHSYNEDKFSVLFTTMDVVLAGDRTFHAGPQPIPQAPATLSGRGLHFTTDGRSYADVWQWKASSGGPAGFMDDDHFGPPLNPTEMQARHVTPYKGGFEPDPGTANYADNFGTDVTGGYNRAVTPRRLPKDLPALTAALGPVDLDPNHGESEGSRWFMSDGESAPYSAELDAKIPDGTVIPGVIVTGQYSGDRADVRCAAHWAAGRWALEVARRLDTHSKYDVPVKTGIFMRVAAFDHNQIRHTRHVRPIRLEVE